MTEPAPLDSEMKPRHLTYDHDSEVSTPRVQDRGIRNHYSSTPSSREKMVGGSEADPGKKRKTNSAAPLRLTLTSILPTAPLLPMALQQPPSDNRAPSIPTPKLRRRRQTLLAVARLMEDQDPYASPCAGVHYVPNHAPPESPPAPPRQQQQRQGSNGYPTKPLPQTTHLPDLEDDFFDTTTRKNQQPKFILQRRPASAPPFMKRQQHKEDTGRMPRHSSERTSNGGLTAAASQILSAAPSDAC